MVRISRGSEAMSSLIIRTYNKLVNVVQSPHLLQDGHREAGRSGEYAC